MPQIEAFVRLCIPFSFERCIGKITPKVRLCKMIRATISVLAIVLAVNGLTLVPPNKDGSPDACADMVCEWDQVCELKTVQCIRAPCPAIPTCVTPEYPTCASTLCEPGTVCQMQDVQCFRAPCPPLPVCIPEPEYPNCDGVECEQGYVCEMQQVICKREPCPPHPACVPKKC